MSNTRLQFNWDDRYYGQLAPSQANRSQFTPGKAFSKPGDENWPLDYLTPTGTPALDVAGPRRMVRVRVYKTKRNVICDQNLVDVPPDPLNTTQINDGRKERNTGYDGIRP